MLLTFAMSCTAHVFSYLSLCACTAFFYLDSASISYYGFGSTVAYYYLLPGLSLLDARVMTSYVQRLGWHVDCTGLIAAYRARAARGLRAGGGLHCGLLQEPHDWCSYPFARTFVFVSAEHGLPHHAGELAL